MHTKFWLICSTSVRYRTTHLKKSGHILFTSLSLLNFEKSFNRFNEARGKLVLEALCYTPEGRGFDSRCRLIFFFSIYLILPAALGPTVYSASNNFFFKLFH
jgi:hypothetical protein